MQKLFVSCNFKNTLSSLSCFDFGTNNLDYFSFFLYRRHVLRFLLQSPHGYHVEMASQTPFVYGDEDTVMACLIKVLLFHLYVGLGRWTYIKKMEFNNRGSLMLWAREVMGFSLLRELNIG